MPAIAKKLPNGPYRILCSVCSHVIVESARTPTNFAELVLRHEKQDCPATVTPDIWSFDNPMTKDFTERRMEFLIPLLRELRKTLGIDSALDVGCGLGAFSVFLLEFGIPRVLGVDGREENVREAQRRNPHVPFQQADAEDLPVESVGVFDLVLCFGLLYHLENPFRALRRLSAATGKILLIESMCVPGEDAKMDLMDEWTIGNQGLNYVAFYPSEACLVKMLRQSGFQFVYRFAKLPDHELYESTIWRRRVRTMLLASKTELSIEGLLLAEVKPFAADKDGVPWATPLARLRSYFRRKLRA